MGTSALTITMALQNKITAKREKVRTAPGPSPGKGHIRATKTVEAVDVQIAQLPGGERAAEAYGMLGRCPTPPRGIHGGCVAIGPRLSLRRPALTDIASTYSTNRLTRDQSVADCVVILYQRPLVAQ